MKRLVSYFLIGVYAFTVILANQSYAARRSVHFASFTTNNTSHAVDQTVYQSNHTQVVCALTIRNVSETVSQNITGIILNTLVLVETGAGSIRNQRGISPAEPRYYLFNSRTGTVVVADAVAPTTAAPKILSPFGSTAAGTYDTLIVRRAASFSINPNVANEPGVGPFQSIMVRQHCTGTIDVADPTGTLSGSVIASGVNEFVADSLWNTGIQYGSTGVNNAGGTTAMASPNAGGAYVGTPLQVAQSQAVLAYSSTKCYKDGITIPQCQGWTGGADITYWHTSWGITAGPTSDPTSYMSPRYSGEYYYSPIMTPGNITRGRCTVTPNVDDGSLYTSDVSYWLQPTKTAIINATFPQHLHNSPFAINSGKPF